MRIGIYFDGFESTQDILDTCKKADEADVESLWFAQHMGYRDAMTLASMAAVLTHKASIVPTAISPYMAPALPVAMGIATMNEIAAGRLKLAVSAGNVLNLAHSGFEATKPVAVLRDYVTALRLLLAGGPVHMEGHVQKLRGAHMAFASGLQVPIYIASTGPKVLKLAGQIGDGILLSAGLTLAHCRACLDRVDDGVTSAGRPASAVRRAGFVNLNVSRDGDSAKRALLCKLAFLFRSKGHAENIRSSGLPIDHAGIMEALGRHDLDAATALLPLEAANVFGVAGTINECRDRLNTYLTEIGLEEPIVEISGDAEERELAFRLIRDVAG